MEENEPAEEAEKYEQVARKQGECGVMQPKEECFKKDGSSQHC